MRLVIVKKVDLVTTIEPIPPRKASWSGIKFFHLLMVMEPLPGKTEP